MAISLDLALLKDKGKELYISFGSARYCLEPGDLIALNLENEGINELKALVVPCRAAFVRPPLNASTRTETVSCRQRRLSFERLSST